MINKLLRQSLKPVLKTLNHTAYKTWLGLFDTLSKRQQQFPMQVKAMGYNWLVHHGATFLNQFEGIFVNEVYAFKSDKESPLIIDCGANMGTSVIYFKTLYPSASIIAFEPDVAIFKVLQHNIETNKLQGIELLNKAVWTANGEVGFIENNAQSGSINEQNKTATVSCIKLSDLLANHQEIDFLKIDIEGAELAVLTDCKNELHRVKHLFIEYHSYTNSEQKLPQLLSILSQANFRYYIQNNEKQSPFLNHIIENGMDLTLDIFAFRD